MGEQNVENLNNLLNDRANDKNKQPDRCILEEDQVLYSLVENLKLEILKRVKISDHTINLVLTAFFSGLHLLLEDLPGMGKTTLAKTLVSCIDNTADQTFLFRRIQFTADLLPYDILGTEIFVKEKNDFIFKNGPIFAGVLLADELNRGNPKVQSALLEAMGENQVTVSNKTYKLHDLFFVIATQNPIEIEGTFPLPRSSLDRFGLSISLGYPSEDQQRDILQNNLLKFNPDSIKKVIKLDDIEKIRKRVDSIYIDSKLIDVINEAGILSRASKEFYPGFSVRALLHLLNASKAYAFVSRGASFVTDDDLKKVFIPVVSHRLYNKFDRTELTSFLDEILSKKYWQNKDN